MTNLAPHVCGFLREHMPRQRNASRHTIASYADSLMLLVRYIAERFKVRPCTITLEQLTVELISAFSTISRWTEITASARETSVWLRSNPFSVILNTVCHPVSTWPGRFMPYL